jgi:hypothetical protein
MASLYQKYDPKLSAVSEPLAERDSTEKPSELRLNAIRRRVQWN